MDEPYSIEEQFAIIKKERQKSMKLMTDASLTTQWKYLYNNVAPIILQACIVNDHHDKFV